MAKKSKKNKHIPNRSRKKKQVSAQHVSTSRQNTLQQALALHKAGRLQKAELIYRQILQTEPDNPIALHFLGLIAYQVEKNDMAVELIGKAVSLKPDYTEAHYNLGNALLVQGKLEEAAACYRRVLALKSDYIEAYNNLGLTLKEQGKLEEAAACYRQVLALKPDFAEAYNNLGLTLHDQDKFDEAVACYHQALSIQPDFAMAYYNLGITLMDQENPEEAVASYRKAIALKPDFVDAYYNLGIVLEYQGKLVEAVASYQQALILDPNFAEAHNNLGVMLREEGKMDDAIASLRKALSLKPDFAGAYKNLTTIVKYTEVDEDIKAMETLYNKKEGISDEDRIVLGFALGKAYQDLRDYDKSFDFIREANRLKRESYDYSIQLDQDLFARIKQIFTPDFFTAHQSSGHQDRIPFFIVGMPRSGTTLVEQILASHPLVFGAGELKILANITKVVCTKEATSLFPECMQELPAEAFERIGKEYIEKIREFSKDAEYITNKLPHNFLRVGLIKTTLPKAKVIHCLREPMDNCFSLFKNDFTAMHEYAYDMIELGRYYNLYQDLMAHWEKVLPGFMYTVKYEELVSDQQNQTRNLLDFCGLPWDEACLAFHKTKRRVSTASLAQVRQPIYKDSVELWRRYEEQLEPLRKTIYACEP